MYLAVAVLDRKGLFYNSMRDTDEVGLHCAIPSTKVGFLRSFWVLSKYSLCENINLIRVHPFLAVLSASPGPRAPTPGRPTLCSSMSKFEISPLTCPHLPVSVVLSVLVFTAWNSLLPTGHLGRPLLICHNRKVLPTGPNRVHRPLPLVLMVAWGKCQSMDVSGQTLRSVCQCL